MRPPPSPKDLGIPLGTALNPTGFVSQYLDVDFTPEYPFGFGLSYTRFEYSNLQLSTRQVVMDDGLTVSADVANVGPYEADEVVQLYTRDLVGSTTRPVRELKSFRRVRLKPGQKETVEFRLSTRDLAFVNDRMQWVTEPGRFHVWIASDAVSGLVGEFEVGGEAR